EHIAALGTGDQDVVEQSGFEGAHVAGSGRREIRQGRRKTDTVGGEINDVRSGNRSTIFPGAGLVGRNTRAQEIGDRDRRQNQDNGNYHQQLDQRKTTCSTPHTTPLWIWSGAGRNNSGESQNQE